MPPSSNFMYRSQISAMTYKFTWLVEGANCGEEQPATFPHEKQRMGMIILSGTAEKTYVSDLFEPDETLGKLLQISSTCSPRGPQENPPAETRLRRGYALANDPADLPPFPRAEKKVLLHGRSRGCFPMPSSSKRDAGVAFDGAASDSPHASKRQRKRNSRKSADESASTSAHATSEETPLKNGTARPPDVQELGPYEVTPRVPRHEPEKSPKSQAKSTRAVETPSKEKGQTIDMTMWEDISTDNTKALAVKTKPSKVSETPSKPKKAQPGFSDWLLSRGHGGTFIEQDPIFTSDNQFLIVPTHSDVKIFSTKTSLLVRSFQVDNKSDITNCALSTADPSRLYVSNSRGLLSMWDWVSGVMLRKQELGRGVQQVLPIHSQDKKEIVLVLQQSEGKGTSAVAFAVDTASNQFNQSQVVLQRNLRLSSIQAHAQGSILVASARDRILVGQSQLTSDGGLDLTYTWREISIPGSIISFDAQINIGKSKTSRKVPFLDVAVGLQNGAIIHYEDVLFKLIGREKKNLNQDIVGRKLHWHRTSVNTLKWSRDRNYLISGGDETVLVIWQLDTNQKQFLPHLSTSILGLTVSASGSSYALRLGDNSIMVLSTADLLPSTNINGLALGDIQHHRAPVVLHPTAENRLFAAIPANPVTKGSLRGKSSTLLQSYDLESGLQIGRQALTRNMTTALNVAPSGQSVQEPNVTHIAVSHDGKWLATVDEWQPNDQDLDARYIEADASRDRGSATETSLRLWTVNDNDNTWELVTRVDEPHKPGPHSILGLAVSPTRLEMATIGSDANIRLWSPKARHRNGVAVRNSSNEQLYTWTCSRTIPCEQDASGRTEAATWAALVYSDDGSVLAGSWSWQSHSTRFVHLIDPRTGQISLSQPDLLHQGDGKMEFSGRYLVCLSQMLTVYDTLTSQVTSTISLDPALVSPQSQAPSFLAVNKLDGTVAVSISKSHKPRSTKVLVLNISGGEIKPLHESSFPGTIRSLLASTTAPGFLIVDDRNVLRSLKPSGSQVITSVISRSLTTHEPEQVTKGLDNIFGRSGVNTVAGTDGVVEDENVGGDVMKQSLTNEDATTSSRDLNSVLRIVSSTQAPSPAELFQRVVGVLAKR
nr:NET1-associated nuclear protein 1 [Exophiala xenobiotica]